VIGPKGAIITSIREVCQVRIETDENSKDKQNRILTIEGNVLGCMLAQSYVYKALSMENSQTLLDLIKKV